MSPFLPQEHSVRWVANSQLSTFLCSLRYGHVSRNHTAASHSGREDTVKTLGMVSTYPFLFLITKTWEYGNAWFLALIIWKRRISPWSFDALEATFVPKWGREGNPLAFWNTLLRVLALSKPHWFSSLWHFSLYTISYNMSPVYLDDIWILYHVWKNFINPEMICNR